MPRVRSVPSEFHRARLLRRNQTDAERRLWKQLRAKRFTEFKFRRQFPIGDFIVDFCCKERRLVNELDGGQHGQSAAIISDAKRERTPQERGYRVIRFWNNQVCADIEGVMQTIFKALGETSP